MADAARAKAMMNGIFISFIPLAEHKLCLTVVSNCIKKAEEKLLRFFSVVVCYLPKSNALLRNSALLPATCSICFENPWSALSIITSSLPGQV